MHSPEVQLSSPTNPSSQYPSSQPPCAFQKRYPAKVRFKKTHKQNQNQVCTEPVTFQITGISEKLSLQNKKFKANIKRLEEATTADQDSQRNNPLYQVAMSYRQKATYLQVLVFKLLERIQCQKKNSQGQEYLNSPLPRALNGNCLNQVMSTKSQEKDQHLSQFTAFQILEPPQRLEGMYHDFKEKTQIYQKSSLTESLSLKSLKDLHCNQISLSSYFRSSQKEYYTLLQSIFDNFLLFEEIRNSQCLEMEEYIIGVKQELSIAYETVTGLREQIKQYTIEHEDELEQMRDQNRILSEKINEYQIKIQNLEEQNEWMYRVARGNEPFYSENNTIRGELDFSRDDSAHKKKGNIIKFYDKIQSMYEMKEPPHDLSLSSKHDESVVREEESILESITEQNRSEISGEIELEYLARIFKAAEKSADDYQQSLKKNKLLEQKLKQKTATITEIHNILCNHFKLSEEQAHRLHEIEGLNQVFMELRSNSKTSLSILQTILRELQTLLNTNLHESLIAKVDKLITMTTKIVKEIQGELGNQSNSENQSYSSQEASMESDKEIEKLQVEENKLRMSVSSTDRMRDTIGKIEDLLLENEKVLSAEALHTIKNIEEMFHLIESNESQENQIDVNKLKDYLSRLEQNILRLRNSSYLQQYQQEQQKNEHISQKLKRIEVENNITKYRITCLMKYLISYQEEHHRIKKFYNLQKFQNIISDMLDYLIKEISQICQSDDYNDPPKKQLKPICQQYKLIQHSVDNREHYKHEGRHSILKTEKDYHPQFIQLLEFLTKQFQELRQYNFPNAYELIEKIEIDLIKISQAEGNRETILYYCKKIFKILEENEQKNRFEFQRRQNIIKYRSSLVSEICQKDKFNQ